MLNKSNGKNRINSRNNLLKNNLKSDVEIGQLFDTLEKEIPGYLSVKIKNHNLENDKIKFFGVKNKGDKFSGQGVEAAKVEDYNDEKLIFFSISNLIKSGQFSEDINEGVIVSDGDELGRDSIDTNPAIYLG